MKSKVFSSFRRGFFAVLLGCALLVLIMDVIRFSVALHSSAGETYDGASVDVVAVLTGGQGRFREAFAFLERNQAKVLFVSGIDEGVRLDAVLKANKIEAKSEDYLGRIFVDRVSRSTLDNAMEIRKIMEWLHAKSVLVVTSSYHMRRAMLMIEREMNKAPAMEARIFSWTVESPNFDRMNWWKSVTGWEIFFSEYSKTRMDELLHN
jgi:uncharacterized SAM-binding protein YcdF (DUF218 family)